jgi:hypothetical protein
VKKDTPSTATDKDDAVNDIPADNIEIEPAGGQECWWITVWEGDREYGCIAERLYTNGGGLISSRDDIIWEDEVPPNPEKYEQAMWDTIEERQVSPFG